MDENDRKLFWEVVTGKADPENIRNLYLLKNTRVSISDDDFDEIFANDRSDVLHELIDRGLNARAASSFGETLLHKAAEAGATECVRVLIAAGADVHADNFVHDKPLRKAANPEIVRLIVAAGADINSVSGVGSSRLTEAAGRNQIEIVRVLLELGANPDAEESIQTAASLYIAVRKEYFEVAKMLIQAGANLNAMTIDEWFPLMEVKSVEMAKLLLDSGANIHLSDDFGSDALHWVDNPEVAAYLIERGARVNPPVHYITSPLIRAVEKKNLPLISTLIASGADVNYATSSGETALMWAAEQNYLEGVRLLLELGSDVNQRDKSEQTALFRAVASEGYPRYRYMKDARDSRSSSDYGYVESDSIEVVELLINAGADINQRDIARATPLLFAASHGRPSRVKALLDLGADATLKDLHGKTALDHAQAHEEADQREEIIRLLEEHQQK